MRRGRRRHRRAVQRLSSLGGSLKDMLAGAPAAADDEAAPAPAPQEPGDLEC